MIFIYCFGCHLEAAYETPKESKASVKIFDSTESFETCVCDASENPKMNSVEYEEIAANFERVLHGLLQQNYSVTSDVYFDMFIKHLSNKTASGIGKGNVLLLLNQIDD